MKIYWDKLAERHGYKNSEEMFHDLVDVQKTSALIIARILKVSYSVIYRKMRSYVKPENGKKVRRCLKCGAILKDNYFYCTDNCHKRVSNDVDDSFV